MPQIFNYQRCRAMLSDKEKARRWVVRQTCDRPGIGRLAHELLRSEEKD